MESARGPKRRGFCSELRGAQKTEPPEGSGEAEPAYATSGPCAYCHISDAADDRVDKLERRFKVGGRFKARVIGRGRWTACSSRV